MGMSAIRHLVSMGVHPVSEGGKLGLLGLKSLDPSKARAILEYATANKPAILAELEAQAKQPDPSDALDRLLDLLAGSGDRAWLCFYPVGPGERLAYTLAGDPSPEEFKLFLRAASAIEARAADLVGHTGVVHG